MTISVHPANGRKVVVSLGEQLDTRTAPLFTILLKQQYRKGMRNFVLDFSRTKTMDSVGLHSIYSIYKLVKPDEGTVCFASASGSVAVVVRMVRLDKVFPQFLSVEAALSGSENDFTVEAA